jgi:GxxExxY protein
MLRIESPLSADLEALVHRTIGCCITVHRELGPGLLEAVYQRAVCIEIETAGISFEREKQCPILYRGKRIYIHRLDLVVSGQILLELKAVDRVHPVHRSQVLSCLRASKLRIGLLINFNVAVLPNGIHRIVL